MTGLVRAAHAGPATAVVVLATLLAVATDLGPGALLGVGAHLLNVLPDLAVDAATGVHGLPHRLGARLIPPVAATVLLTATMLLVIGVGKGRPSSIATFVAVCVLAGVVVLGRGRTPFLAAVLIALADVALLLAAT